MEMLVSNATLLTPSFGITDVTEGVIMSDEHVSVLTVDDVSLFFAHDNIVRLKSEMTQTYINFLILFTT